MTARELTNFWEECEHGLSDLSLSALELLRDQVLDEIHRRLVRLERGET